MKIPSIKLELVQNKVKKAYKLDKIEERSVVNEIEPWVDDEVDMMVDNIEQYSHKIVAEMKK